ncbi:kelch motif family protein [Stylonychia lemnae]|uniref:Kelch motif family protein n=1 Tax=Stylonychia lemnae TaxID=5949 RepID=A0A078BB84_STYLE|nr:kelch motif family protein [Stylonychia lemnae]|eukprot:CDW91820.1 kelch motif family protein [Stylonychia lemnae]
MEKSSQNICQIHKNQPLLLFCMEDKQKLCLKCVTQHVGHTISDFEDVCKAVIIPRIQTEIEEQFSKMIVINQNSEQIQSYQSQVKTKLLKQVEEVETKVDELLKNIQSFKENYVKKVEDYIDSNDKEIQTLNDYINSIQPLNQEFVKYFDVINELNNEIEHGKIIDMIYGSDESQTKEDIIKAKINLVEKLQLEKIEKLSEQEEIIKNELMIDIETISNDVISVLNSSKESQLNKQNQKLPVIYQIDENRCELKYFDLNQRQIFTRKISYDTHIIPLFTGVGSVLNRIFLFGGKDRRTKEITCQSYEVIKGPYEDYDLALLNKMSKNRSRCAVASFNKKFGKFDPFLVIVGGSDQYNALNHCELYYPKTDTYYNFPNLMLHRENSSVCLMDNCSGTGKTYLYCFGGFNKQAIDQIERIEINFDQDGTHPLNQQKWEILKNVTMDRSAESCGLYQLSENEIMIFGGFQRGEDDSTQVMIYNIDSQSFLGIRSRLKEQDCFALASFTHIYSDNQEVITPNEENQLIQKSKESKHLYAFSIFGKLHCMDFNTFEWNIILDNSSELVKQPQN